MGTRLTKAARRAEFLRDNPRCCFCNGERAADELDHAPARICFRQKQGPEGFEFPSCVPCNRAASLSEQVIAFHIRMMDQTGVHLDDGDVDKLITGVLNNAPSAMPILNAAAAARIRGILTDDIPVSSAERVMEINESVHDYVEVFGTKMLYAMRYRETGQMAGPKLRRWVRWAQVGTSTARYLTDQAEVAFGKVHEAGRLNVDLGDQFRYRHAFNAAHGFLGLWMQFGQSIMLFCVLGPGSELAKLKDAEFKRYLPIRELGVGVNQRHRNRAWTIKH